MTSSHHRKKQKKEQTPAPARQTTDAAPREEIPEAEIESLPGGEDEAAGAVEIAEEPDQPEKTDQPEEPDPLEALARERDAFQEKWLRAVAELDNLRKRSRRELADSRRLAQADVLRPILGVMDNFERALQSLHENKDNADLEKFLEGVDLIFQNFQGVLRDVGVVPLDAMGVEFDPNFHEAVGQLPREGVEADQVIEVVQKGFMFGQQVLRPAKVIISA